MYKISQLKLKSITLKIQVQVKFGTEQRGIYLPFCYNNNLMAIF